MGKKLRGEVMFSGVGGGGVLLAGECTARAALQAYEHVVWFPNYSAAVRGGACECFVIFSDDEIASPVLSQVQSVVILDPAQLKASEERVRPGGVLIIESTGLKDRTARKDITVITVPAQEQARAMGNPRGANFIILGKYIGVSKLLDPALVEKDLESRFGNNAEVLAANLKAFRMGLQSGVKVS